MSKVAWFKFYPNDFLHGVRYLSPNEIAVYIVMLSEMYDSGGPIEEDARRIGRACNMRTDVCKRAIDRLISAGKLIRDGGFLINERANLEIENRLVIASQMRSNVNKRWRGKPEKTNKNKEPVLPGHPPRNTEPKPTRVQSPEINKDTNVSSSIPRASGAADGDDLDGLETKLRSAGGKALDPTAPSLSVLSAPLRWREHGADLAKDILPAIKATAGRSTSGSIRSWEYFNNPVMQALEDRRHGRAALNGVSGQGFAETGVTIGPDDLTNNQWRLKVRWYRDFLDKDHSPDHKNWHDCFGPAPGEPGCKAPVDVLAEYGFSERTDA